MAQKRYISSSDFQSPVSRSESRAQHLAVQKALGARIAELRKKKKKTSQERLADLCGLHRSHMGEIERGESNFTLGTLLLLVKQLEITVPELFNGIA
jgi:DNA-binding XRE family transcriptional regulator